MKIKYVIRGKIVIDTLNPVDMKYASVILSALDEVNGEVTVDALEYVEREDRLRFLGLDMWKK